MPFTPLHMGPGMAIKAITGRHFSLVGFGVAQILIDIEPLLRILRDDPILHGPSHSFAGALLVAALALPVARVIHPPLARWFNGQARAHRLDVLAMPLSAPWPALLAGVLVGSLSHVAIDSIMHADLRPLWPFADGSPLYGWIAIDALHLACVIGGVIGAALWLLSALARRRPA